MENKSFFAFDGERSPSISHTLAMERFGLVVSARRDLETYTQMQVRPEERNHCIV